METIMTSVKAQATPRGQEPPMYLQRPSTGRSQDVRHILARTFRDLYTRDAVRPDTVKNLQVSKGGDDPYHERYVENLQQVYTEWQRRMDEAAMLERHIMQAQARAMSADERELNKASLSCDSYSNLGLPPVRAHFRSCIDSQLLKQHNLLTPSDYIVQEPLPVPAPQETECCECWPQHRPKIPDYARDTLASRQHSRQNTKLEGEVPLAWMPGESMEFPTFVSDIDIREETEEKEDKSSKVQPEFPQRSGWKEFTSEDQREADRRVLDMLQAKVNFLRNPRHVPPSAAPGGRSLIKASKRTPKEIGIQKEADPLPTDCAVFVPSPPVVAFKNCNVGEVYEMTLELKNMSTVMRQCRVLPPTSNIFSVGLGQFPSESGLVAPGMSCKYDIRFAPDSFKDYDDQITVLTQATEPLVIPLLARREPPMLTLPEEIDLGSCLVGGLQATQLLVKNEGGTGRFCLMSRNKWPTTSIRTVIPNITKITIKQPPFEIHPATFELGKGQSTVLEVLFNPQAEKTYVQEMTIACDNCHASHFKIKGEGEVARVGLASVERGLSEPKLNEMNDVSAKNLLKFDDLNPFTYTERTVKVCNFTKVELPFQWMVYKPIMPKDTQACLPSSQPAEHSEEERVPDLDSVFSVFPTNGILQPAEIADFKFTFAPPAEGNFHSVVHMMLQHVPPRKESVNSVDGQSRPGSTEGVAGNTEEESNNILSGGGVLPFRDITGLEVEVKGECIPLNVVLHPYAMFVSAPSLVGSTIKRLFTMANHSYSAITFQWEPYTDSYLLEVEPPFGELDPGMAMDLEVSITGIEPGKISHTLLCYVMNMAEPLHLHVDAHFKGPELRIEEPSINFGLVRVGKSEQKKMTIVNASQIVVKFNIVDSPTGEECEDSMAASDLSFSEMSGELKPLERRTVTLTLAPTCVRSVKRVVQVEYDGGETCHIGVYGEAQKPIICLLECDKFLPEVYLQVPVVFNAVLHNQTLLPTTFKWGKVEGSQKDDCVIEIQEIEGKIKSWEQKSVAIAFTPLKAMSYSEVRLPCKVGGQEEELFLNVSCDVRTLAVSYKTSTDSHLISDELLLNFGDENALGETVKRYVHICNQTAICAPFKVSVEHFTATLPAPPEGGDTQTARSQRRNLLNRTPNIADPLSKTPLKAKEDYNKLVLHEKKGAAFLVLPATGMLQPFEEQAVEVMAHSDMWGSYHDNLIFKVGDLDDVKIPMDMKVLGCPLSFQLTAGQPEQKPVVRFGTHVSGVSPINRKLKINNSSPKDVRVDWQVFKQENNPDKLINFITCFGRAFPPRDKFGNEIIPEKKKEPALSPPNMDVILNSPDTSVLSASLLSRGQNDSMLSSHPSEEDRPKIVSCYVRPHDGVVVPKPYTIKPAQMVIPAQSSSLVDLTFSPLPTSEVAEEMDCFGYALGFMSLDNEDANKTKVNRQEAYEADVLRLDFTAHLKPALLTVEETDDEGMCYRSAMSDIIKGNKVTSESLRVCSTMLSNNTLTPLTFRLKVEEPFLLVDLDPSSNAEGLTRGLSTSFCSLNPRHNFMVKVAFKVSPSILHNNSFPERKEESEDETVERKLEFKDELLIQFDNGAQQTVPLFATLAVPQMELSTDELDFGTCLVGQTRIKELIISNRTASHSHWSILVERKCDNCSHDTFCIEPSQGMLEAHITHVSNSKSIIKVYFTAKHSESYDCTFLVKGMLGEDSRRIHVYGCGSYDGKHEAILNV
ncbi:deleted in lung and esophageal cancer protein 1 [Aplysia californica]|uniref:Deleted in lung and esophageal cancer protein 1 n=1 Tax=Aplysia californica TaxID=6500 RepID=A0ABM1A3W2_APLCA|nr:deleted in lung and esophageal cancer protein 1 [Aplysia californica]